VGTGHIVIRAKDGAGSHGGGFLTDGQMNKSGDQVLLEQLTRLFFEGPDQEHFFQKLEHLGFAQFSLVHRHTSFIHSPQVPYEAG
jgi:hypothetical protein